MRLFQESAIFLLPSYVENFPLVALEAAAAGLALVLSPVGAVPEFFEHGRSAWFVTPGSVEEIAGAVRTLTREVDVRMRLAAAARTTFRTTLARERIFASLDDVYTAALRS
jgi:glycosyltransferase involved in cell wall biosynthesis